MSDTQTERLATIFGQMAALCRDVAGLLRGESTPGDLQRELIESLRGVHATAGKAIDAAERGINAKA